MGHSVQLTNMHLAAAGGRLHSNLSLHSLPSQGNITHRSSFFLGKPALREDPVLSKGSYPGRKMRIIKTLNLYKKHSQLRLSAKNRDNANDFVL